VTIGNESNIDCFGFTAALEQKLLSN